MDEYGDTSRQHRKVIHLRLSTRFFFALHVMSCILPQVRNIDVNIPVKKLHEMMNKKELRRIFDVEEYTEVPEYQVIHVRMRHRLGERSMDENYIEYQTYVFGQQVELTLKLNNHLLSPNFTVVESTETTSKKLAPPSKNCHYNGRNNNTLAAFSYCGSDIGMKGIIILSDRGFDIKPVPDRLKHHVQKKDVLPQEDTIPHIVTEPSQSSVSPTEEYEEMADIPTREKMNQLQDENTTSQMEKRAVRINYLELAIFVDEMAYKKFRPLLESEEDFENLIIGFTNQLEALFCQPFLGSELHIILVYLNIMKELPQDFHVYNNERYTFLREFCKYQTFKNPRGDDNPNHWDMALFLSGRDFYHNEGWGKKHTASCLAPIDGVCKMSTNCVICELGATNSFGKPYFSAGLAASYSVVHEIAHNLGLYHDGWPKNFRCKENGFIMSPSRASKGENTWSSCSKKLLKSLSKSCLKDHQTQDDSNNLKELPPGQTWDVYEQCKFYIKDEEATLYNPEAINEVCNGILCKSPNRIGNYEAGPALEGTYCGKKNWCKNGQCVSWGNEPLEVVEGGWSDWQNGQCKSGCIQNSRGFREDRRYCTNPKPKNTETRCVGEPRRVQFCDDSDICHTKIHPVKYASKKCEEFSTILKKLTKTGVQARHDNDKKWQACAIFCKQTTGQWYTPSFELNNMDIETFFPEGTWCHNDGTHDYFCQNRECKPSVRGRSLFYEEKNSGFKIPVTDSINSFYESEDNNDYVDFQDTNSTTPSMTTGSV
ncbi:A disintegrin and metalloproteinase with thrombospondin motifs 16-like [Tachypleus tridentatus]|uniref:A disintegrin and metalloproteinase with thrombospondin motifs 16-like n=1 Tax=Tachypleus tridentatus TaxID=6853 RepID=UPI003FD1E02E